MGTGILLFWMSLLCAVFFLLGLACRIVMTIADSLFISFDFIVKVAIVAAAGVLAFEFLYAIVDSFSTGDIAAAITLILFFVLLVLVTLWVIDNAGGVIMDIILMIVAFVSHAISFVMQFGCEVFEKAYSFFLTKIKNKIELC